MKKEQQAALDSGINLFNQRQYFNAHEEWESEWRIMTEGEEKNFFQGLIMIAGAFLHYVRHECAGAKELLERSIEPLRSGIEDFPEISVAEFVGRLEKLRDTFAECTFRVQPNDLPIISRNLVHWDR